MIASCALSEKKTVQECCTEVGVGLSACVDMLGHAFCTRNNWEFRRRQEGRS